MELDELKNAWRKDEAQSSLRPGDLNQMIVKRLASSGKGIYRKVVFEIGFAILFYLVMLIVVVVFNQEFGAFFYKTIGVITILAILVSYRLIQSARMLKKQDLSIPLTTNLEIGLTHFRQTIHLYKVLSYVALGFLLLVYATDEFFISLSRIWKAASRRRHCQRAASCKLELRVG